MYMWFMYTYVKFVRRITNFILQCILYKKQKSFYFVEKIYENIQTVFKAGEKGNFTALTQAELNGSNSVFRLESREYIYS